MINTLLKRDKNSNKYDFGHVFVIGGAPGMAGAPLLSALAALRVGAGLVSIASSEDVVDKLEKRVLEVMTIRLPQNNVVDFIVEFIKKRRVNVLVIGPGFDEQLLPSVEKIVSELKIPIVLDAGAMMAFKNRLERFKSLTSNGHQLILTPHDGEFKKLNGVEMPILIEERKVVAANFAKETGVVLVSKGAKTIVSSPSSQFVNDTGNPGMATAGTGDVLCGVIAGLIAQGIEVECATQNAVHLHGLAGDIASHEKTQAGMIASDIVEFIPQALKAFSDMSETGGRTPDRVRGEVF